MIELVLLIITICLFGFGLYLLRKFSDNEQLKDNIRLQRHGNRMSVSCLFQLWILLVWIVMAIPHHLSFFWGHEYLFISELHEYRMLQSVVGYAVIGITLKIQWQIIEYQKQRRKTD